MDVKSAESSWRVTHTKVSVVLKPPALAFNVFLLKLSEVDLLI
jgi:hypothetical protein